MTELSTVWDGILTGDAAAVAPYSASEWAARQKLLQGQGTVFPNYGVLVGTGDGTYPALSVQAKSPATTQIEIEIGAALVAGYLYQNTAALSFTVGANASGNARVDTVILRVDFVAQTVRGVVKQGTPAASPVAPAMQQDATYWEIPLADIAVANGFVTLAQSTITQRQRGVRANAAGWQSIAYPPNYVFRGYEVLSIISELLSASNRGTILIPFNLTGNMLLQQVDMWIVTTTVAYIMEWDLYIQDTNDGLVAENSIRRVATSGSVSGTLPGAAATLSLQAQGGIVPLAPGAYWLAWQNLNTGGSDINVGSIGTAVAGFDSVVMHAYIKNTGLAVNGQTLDAATGWTALSVAPMARLRGRVFGKTTVP